MTQPVKTNDETQKYKAVTKAITALREALAEQPAPLTDTELINRGCHYQTELTQPAQQEPVDSTQVSKVWWDGEKLMAKPIPFVEFYKPAQRTWVGLTPEELDEMFSKTLKGKKLVNWIARAIEAKLKEKNT